MSSNNITKALENQKHRREEQVLHSTKKNKASQRSIVKRRLIATKQHPRPLHVNAVRYSTSLRIQWEPAFLKRRLVRDHEKKEDEQESNTPWRPSRSMKRVPLRKRHKNWEITG